VSFTIFLVKRKSVLLFVVLKYLRRKQSPITKIPAHPGAKQSNMTLTGGNIPKVNLFTRYIYTKINRKRLSISVLYDKKGFSKGSITG
jgi:hypothetical protein